MRVTVYRLERIRMSASGNPRFKVHTDKGVFVTASDYSFVYGIENDWAGKDSRPAEIQVERSKITALRYLDQEEED